MRRRRVLFLAAGVLFLAGGLLMFISLVAAEFQPERFSKNGSWEERNYRISAQDVTLLYLSAQDFAITLSPHQGSDIEIRYYVNEAVDYEESCTDGQLSFVMERKEPRSWLWWLDMNFDFHDYTIEVRIPQDHVLSAQLHSSNGAVTVDSLAFSRLFVQTSNAPITLGDIRCAGEVLFKSSNGALTAENITAGERFSGTCSNGAIALAGITAGELSVKTSNGSIRFAQLSFARAELTTSNNSITGSLPAPEADYTLTARTSNGSITAGAVQQRGGELRKGSGPHTLQLKTSNNSIQVRFGAQQEGGGSEEP